MLRKRFTALLMAGVVAAMSLAGCGSSGDSSGTGTENQGEKAANAEESAGGTVVMARSIDSETLDPALASKNQDIWMMNFALEGLVRSTEDGKDVEPAVADSWTISDDYLTYTFHLRDGIKFSNGEEVTKLGGYTVVGTIEIPKIDIKYPILENVTKKSIELAVAVLYGPGLNQVGNTVIVGHNYRNGTMFSNISKLSNGDTIYITDTTGERVKYSIYNMYQTTAEDFDYATRDTEGKREISLSTCVTNDSAHRTIIWAAAD